MWNEADLREEGIKYLRKLSEQDLKDEIMGRCGGLEGGDGRLDNWVWILELAGARSYSASKRWISARSWRKNNN
jgi:hypothetical protein